MTREEFYNYIELGSLYGVRVDVRLMPEYPGYVRVTGFHRENWVIIEFYALGYNEDAAIEIVGEFPSLDLATSSIEDYLGMPIEKWHNYNKSGEYPSVPDHPNLQKIMRESHRKLVMDILSQKVKLPAGVPFKSKHKFWNSIEEYDESIASAYRTYELDKSHNLQ